MKFVNILFDKVKNLDAKVVKVMRFGFIFSFMICILSSLVLLTYEAFYSLPTLFYIGISLFKTSLSFAVAFFICGISFDTIQKEIKGL